MKTTGTVAMKATGTVVQITATVTDDGEFLSANFWVRALKPLNLLIQSLCVFERRNATMSSSARRHHSPLEEALLRSHDADRRVMCGRTWAAPGLPSN